MLRTVARSAFVLLPLLALCFLAGCGKAEGRIPFSSEGAHETELTLSAKEVSFWTELDIEYEGDASLQYRIDLVQNGATVGSAVCDPLGKLPVKTGWLETNIGSSHSRRGTGKMSCSATLASGGPTTLKAALAFGQKPEKVTLKKADLIVKQ